MDIDGPSPLSARTARLTLLLITQHLPPEQCSTCDMAVLQVMNRWRHRVVVRADALGRRLGRVAAQRLGVKGGRVDHDQALHKAPGGGITPAHADLYDWSLAGKRWVTAWIPRQPKPEDIGPLGLWARSQSVEFGRQPGISDESGAKINASMACRGFAFDSGRFDLGDVSFHVGRANPKAGASLRERPRAVVTPVDRSAETKLARALGAAQANEGDHWRPGVLPGQWIDTPMNPVVYAGA